MLVFEKLSSIMISRRDKLLNYPWQQQRFEQHRQKVRSAKPAIDMRTPPAYSHVTTKPKKIQNQKERLAQIEKENVRLLQKLADIMKTKRIENFWIEPRPNFLNREKIFETRPHTSLPRIVSAYAPFHANGHLSNLHADKHANRCRTCNSIPMGIVIPEKQIPWAPPRRSANVKNQSNEQKQICPHCGHRKELE